ncbi:MAG: energy-coupling factor transporter ATPase, partial [Oliverpabstia sp.]
GMTAYRKHSPNKLSGGQKQRVAIAGVMAMKPKCIVLDEPTAMLDPNGRKEVLKAVRELNQKEGVTVILITHYMEEVVFADDVYVMDQGYLVMHGKPREIFSQVKQLKKYRLDVPQVTMLAYELRKNGLDIPKGILTIGELLEALQDPNLKAPDNWEQMEIPQYHSAESSMEWKMAEVQQASGETSLRLEHVYYTYSPGTAYEMHALKDINLEIPQGQFVGIIGHTGSGKSTLIQHFNGLVRPTQGKIYFEGQDIWAEQFPLRGLRSQVGLVFQYPEHQLFETDVLTDVCFGPKNQNLTQEECEERAKEALTHVGLDESYYAKSPFELSGGQKRRVAIAGVLAMNPKVLILDEPTAGLDPQGRDEILDQIASLHKTRGITIILVSHSMEDIAKYVDRIIVMNHGVKEYDDAPKKVFSHYRELEKIGLAAPQITYIMHALSEKGLDVDVNATTVEEARVSIMRAIEKRGAV